MIAIAVVFMFGLATTVYLSLRSPEVKVPEVVGKDRFEAERVLGDAGLNFRVRATRPNSEMNADTVLFQLPRAGEMVKVGQTVAMDISRKAKEGEASETVVPEKSPEATSANENTNDSPANENKPRRNRNTNKNDNTNQNSNTNNRNANRNVNSGNTNRSNANANRSPANANSNANRSVNANGAARPVVPRPSPTARPRQIPD